MNNFGSLEKNPDFKRAKKAGRVSALAKTPRPLPLPFLGKPARVFDVQVRATADRFAAIGIRHAVIGLSGGLDSALALLVTVAAFDRLGLSRSGIHVVTMPGFGTSKRTKGNADLLAEGLGLALKTIPIAAVCRRHLRDIGHDGRTPDVVYENVQARMRTMILMDLANRFGGIVVGTGDMSEIALGWCTYNGDHMSMFGVNAGVPKTVVRETCLWWAAEVLVGKKTPGAGSKAKKAARALVDIAATPVSPELVKGQVTEDKIGPYALHDHFLAEIVGRNRSKAEAFASAFRKYGKTYGAETVGRTLDTFLRRLVTQAFKRNCAPDGVKVFRDVYFGPEDWHIPSITPSSWVKDV